MKTERDDSMLELVRRSFVVDVAIDRAWEHLARIEQWPSWAKHIKKVTLEPRGVLTAASKGAFRLAGGMRSTFRMELFEPRTRWMWVGTFATVRVHYDHRFTPINDDRTELTWIVNGEGPGTSTLGRLFGAIYARNLDKAIANLQAELA